MFEQHEGIYKPSDIGVILPLAVKDVQWKGSARKKNTTPYLNCPIAFDIETTSTYINDEKRAWMYVWQFGINGYVIVGRTWAEFKTMLKTISEYLNLNPKTRRIICYVHNLAYEMGWLQSLFSWEEMFCLETRHPVKACTEDGIEFRCSYILSGMSLANVGKNLHKYKVEKMTGDLDYDLVRHNETPITDTELKYCENDVRVVMSYIAEKIEEDGDISKILLTKTGYVRKYIRSHTIGRNKNYYWLMRRLTLSVDEYLLAKEAFAGGFTHANPHYVDLYMTQEDYGRIDSLDFCSSYPTSLCAFPYPMSKGFKVQIDSREKFWRYYKNYLTIFEVCFTNLRPKPNVPDNILSLSKCRYVDETPYREKDAIVNNGRVVIAYKPIVTTVTGIDFECLNMFYDYDGFMVKEMWCYKAGYLPRDFIECIAHFYQQKTVLKGLEGEVLVDGNLVDAETFYAYYKSMLNSVYGMACTDIIKPEISFDEEDSEWIKADLTKEDIETLIAKNNNSKSRATFYLWGCFCTAYSRRNLYSGILEFGDDYLYSDTDSIKCKNFEKHKKYFEDYNKWIIGKLKAVDEYYNLGGEWISPKDKDGIEHPLGVWDWETEKKPYTKWKTLGAKRYLVEQDGKNKMTVAGLPKKCILTLEEKFGDKLFDRFDTGLTLAGEDTEKNLLTYFDNFPFTETVTDYLGNVSTVSEISYVHMETTEFSFDRNKSFIDYLIGIRQERKV